MNVASLELCKELYELSGWGAELNDWRSNSGTVISGAYPAYDLGYLLRKLPNDHMINFSRPPVKLYQSGHSWTAEYGGFKSGDTAPEDAVCKLAIELFKQGVLKP